MNEQHDQQPYSGEDAREERIKQLMLAAVARCGECRRRYALEDFDVIGHRDHLWMVTVICEGCRSQGFITAIVEDPANSTTTANGVGGQSLTDLTSTEVARFADTAPVNSVDLLDIHEFLDDFDGDFATLFGRQE